MLVGKPFSGTTAACLHLVEYQEQTIFIGYLPQSRQEIIRWLTDSAFTLYRFDQNGRGFIVDFFLYRGQVAVRRINEPGKQGTNIFMVLGLSGG
jgi:hypothetical protein